MIQQDYDKLLPKQANGELGYLDMELQVLQKEVVYLSHVYDQMTNQPVSIFIGTPVKPEPLYPGEIPPWAVKEAEVKYSKKVFEAYKYLCQDYDQIFTKEVVEPSKSINHDGSSTDYAYAPGSVAYQIDTAALPEEFISFLDEYDFHPKVIAEFFKQKVYELEPSIAYYGLNDRLFGENGQTNVIWQKVIEQYRQQYGKKVVVLAGSMQKHQAMLASELGMVDPSQELSAKEIKMATGFDGFWSPEDLKAYFSSLNGQESEYLFFGRFSMPVEWLKNPEMQIESFLSDPELLNFVRQYSITHNVDDPNSPYGINDTKEALVRMGGAWAVNGLGDIYSDEFLSDLQKKKQAGMNDQNLAIYVSKLPLSQKLSPDFANYLSNLGIDMQNADDLQHLLLRAKPLRLHYGGYGHITKANPGGMKFMKKLSEEMSKRGAYVVQLEKTPVIGQDVGSGKQFKMIDRVFMVNMDGQWLPMDSVRSMMPVETEDAKQNIIHEGKNTHCMRISPESYYVD